MEFPLNEQKWQETLSTYHIPLYNDMSFSTVFPDGTSDMDAWNDKLEKSYEGWKEAMNVSVAYSRFDSVKEYLKRKLFKIKGTVELEDTRERMSW